MTAAREYVRYLVQKYVRYLAQKAALKRIDRAVMRYYSLALEMGEQAAYIRTLIDRYNAQYPEMPIRTE